MWFAKYQDEIGTGCYGNRESIYNHLCVLSLSALLGLSLIGKYNLPGGQGKSEEDIRYQGTFW